MYSGKSYLLLSIVLCLSNRFLSPSPPHSLSHFLSHSFSITLILSPSPFLSLHPSPSFSYPLSLPHSLSLSTSLSFSFPLPLYSLFFSIPHPSLSPSLGLFPSFSPFLLSRRLLTYRMAGKKWPSRSLIEKEKSFVKKRLWLHWPTLN